jgi:hypothetical protein
MTIVFVAGLLSFSAPASRAVGPFMNVADMSEFIRTRADARLTGSITRADSRGRGASTFDFAAFFPLRSSFLLKLEISYIALAADDRVIGDFGDAILRVKAHAWTGDRSTLALISSVRFGTGSPGLFPYSTASTDVEIGAAFVDSLGSGGAANQSRLLSYWITATGTYVVRLNDRLEEEELHGDHVLVGGGVVVGISRRFGVEVGGVGLAFDTGAVREVYFARLTAALSPATNLQVSVQGEGGDWEDRAVDASAAVGLTVVY